MMIDRIFDFTIVILSRHVVGLLSFFLFQFSDRMSAVVVTVMSIVFKEWLDIALLFSLSIDFTVVIFWVAMLNFIVISASVVTIGLSVMDSVLGLISVNIEVLDVFA